MKKNKAKRVLKVSKEYCYLELVADALTHAGYQVEQPPTDCDYLDIWGYETIPGRKRRRKCFLEVYCVVHIDAAGYPYAYWTVDYTNENESVCTTAYVPSPEFGVDINLFELLDALSPIIAPLNKRGNK